MNKVLTITFISVVFILLLVPINTFAQYPETGDKYETLGVRHSTNPHVCLFEPDPDRVDPFYWSDVQYQSWKALLEWQISMQEFAPEGDWSMSIHSTVPFEEHENKTPDEYRHCTVFLTYEIENTKEDSKALGQTGIDFKKSSHKFFYITIFLHHTQYNNIVLDLDLTNAKTNPETGLTEFKINLEKKELPMNSVYNIVLHEFGHALGLRHYNAGEFPEPQGYGHIRSAMTPSLDPFKMDQNFKLTIADQFMLSQIYGMDGYGKPQPIIIPDYCLFTGNGTKSSHCE
tara:strand:- start:5 stop:865 length:861 start_codon:yes stop_codon:yes gene_type:complete